MAGTGQALRHSFFPSRRKFRPDSAVNRCDATSYDVKTRISVRSEIAVGRGGDSLQVVGINEFRANRSKISDDPPGRIFRAARREFFPLKASARRGKIGYMPKRQPERDDLVIKPTSDIFTAVLWSAPKNEPLLRSFLNGVLADFGEPPITEATVLNPFSVKDFASDKSLVLDVRVRDEANKLYNVEVQSADHTGFRDRTLLYWADTYSSVLRVGDAYAALVPVKSVILAGFPIFPELNDLHTVFEARSRENPAVLLSDHFQVHFLRLGDMLARQMAGLGALDRVLRHWMNFFAFGDTLPEDKMSQLVENDAQVRQAYREFQRFTTDAEMRERVRDRQRSQMAQKVYVDAAKAEAKAEGKAERDLDIARNMKRKGYPVADISEITGLSAAEIERLG